MRVHGDEFDDDTELLALEHWPYDKGPDLVMADPPNDDRDAT